MLSWAGLVHCNINAVFDDGIAAGGDLDAVCGRRRLYGWCDSVWDWYKKAIYAFCISYICRYRCSFAWFDGVTVRVVV